MLNPVGPPGRYLGTSLFGSYSHIQFPGKGVHLGGNKNRNGPET